MNVLKVKLNGQWVDIPALVGPPGETGETGTTGPQGPTGATPHLSVGTVSTGNEESEASVSITGTDDNPVLNFTIPRGATGEPGPQGNDGASPVIDILSTYTLSPGANAQVEDIGTPLNPRLIFSIPRGADGVTPQITATALTLAAGEDADVVVTGDSTAKNFQFKIPRGNTGSQGPIGPTPEFDIGSVSTGSPGSNASASITGTAAAPRLNLSIPRGFQGERGVQGETGLTPQLSIGTVTTGAAGSQASATLTGTAAAPILNLTIPRGDNGQPGNLYVHICTSTEYDSATRMPTVSSPDMNTVYLVPGVDSSSPDLYVEWVYVNNAWEKFGSASIDLSGYALTSDIPNVDEFATKKTFTIETAVTSISSVTGKKVTYASSSNKVLLMGQTGTGSIDCKVYSVTAGKTYKIYGRGDGSVSSTFAVVGDADIITSGASNCALKQNIVPSVATVAYHTVTAVMEYSGYLYVNALTSGNEPTLAEVTEVERFVVDTDDELIDVDKPANAKAAGDAIRSIGSSIAPIETATATTAHAVGELFVLNNTLMVALSAIAVGDTIMTEGQNANAAATSLFDRLIKDVQVNGTSVVSNGVATISVASTTETQEIISAWGANA